MTEAEALTKWCPFARLTTARPHEQGAVVGPGETVFNRAHDAATVAMFLPAGALCIASACMAWRVNTYGEQPTRVHPDVLQKAWLGWTVTDPTPDANGYVGISPPHSDTDGFCGLAGADR